MCPITTISGSQIKLFIQINDLETSEFVSEMLGETTQVYKTPVMRPGRGSSRRASEPHTTPRGCCAVHSSSAKCPRGPRS
nr:TraM recognition domain-containing protein [Mesorhizobium japonicum]